MPTVGTVRVNQAERNNKSVISFLWQVKMTAISPISLVSRTLSLPWFLCVLGVDWQSTCPDPFSAILGSAQLRHRRTREQFPMRQDLTLSSPCFPQTTPGSQGSWGPLGSVLTTEEPLPGLQLCSCHRRSNLQGRWPRISCPLSGLAKDWPV